MDARLCGQNFTLFICTEFLWFCKVKSFELDAKNVALFTLAIRYVACEESVDVIQYR